MIARVCGFDELPEWVNKSCLSNNGAGKEYASYLLIEDGEYKEVYSSAMEPEDVSFWRDLDWVAFEINRTKESLK